MTELRTFALPDAGEGLTEAEVIKWLVAPGDEVRVNQPIVEIETAKAVVELPSPFDAKVVEILVPTGALVPVGTELIRFEVALAAAAVPTPPTGSRQVHREPVLVGYGTATESIARRPRRDVPAAPSQSSDRVMASPPVRALARSLGVDLADVKPTGPGGTVTRADVTAKAGGSSTQDDQRAQVVVARPTSEAGEQRIPVRGVLRSMAEAMVRSAFTAPHVTEWVSVDVTRSLDLLEQLKARAPEVRFTPMTLISAALMRAVRRNPRINASWQETDIVVPAHVDLGIAVATDRGLLVPSLPGADKLDLAALANGIAAIVADARDGKLTPAQLSGGTITITNVGVFGVDGGTPILNPGQAAILCAGRIAPRPWVVTDAGGTQVLAVRQVMELTLSFDHRVIDGAIGSRALADIAEFLGDPAATLLLDT